MSTLTTGGMINVIQRGLAGHLTYISAAAAWGTNSELALYQPIAAIFMGREWDCRCQQRLARSDKKTGAPRTIDFVARRRGELAWAVAMEVKLLSTRSKTHEVEVAGDIAKLSEFKESNHKAIAYLLVVGRSIEINKAYIRMSKGKTLLSAHAPVIANLGQTAWGSVAIRV